MIWKRQESAKQFQKCFHCNTWQLKPKTNQMTKSANVPRVYNNGIEY